jgi:hypothetical protein
LLLLPPCTELAGCEAPAPAAPAATAAYETPLLLPALQLDGVGLLPALPLLLLPLLLLAGGGGGDSAGAGGSTTVNSCIADM